MRLAIRRNRQRDEHGAVLILGALFAVVAVLAAALAVDVGALVLQKRSNQRVADLASLDGARGLRVTNAVRMAVEQLAFESAARNGFPLTVSTRSCPLTATGATYTRSATDTSRWMKVEIGKMVPTGVGDNADFVPQACPLDALTEVLGPDLVDAVRVTVSSPVAFNFIHGSGTETATGVSQLKVVPGTPGTGGTTSTSSSVPGSTTTSTTTPPGPTKRAGVRVGSRMASIDTTRAALLNSILERALDPAGLTPPVVSVSAVGYTGLADAVVTVADLATALGLQAGTVDQVLGAQLSFDQLLSATAMALQANNNNAAAATVTAIGTTIPLNFPMDHQPVTLGQFSDPVYVSGEAFDSSPVAQAEINVLDLVRSGAMLANGTNFLAATVPVTIPGVTSATMTLALIEGVKSGGPGPEGTTAHTAQLTSTVTLRVAVSVAGVSPFFVDVPVIVEGGGADATITKLTCNAAGDAMQSVEVTGEARTFVAKTGAFTAKVTASLPLIGSTTLTVSASEGAPVTTSGGTHVLTFTDFSAMQSLPASQLGAQTVPPSSITVTDPLGNTTALSPTIATAVSAAVNTALASYDTTVAPALYDAAGVGYANADVWVFDPECTPPGSGSSGGSTSSTTTTLATTATSTPGTPATYSEVPILVK